MAKVMISLPDELLARVDTEARRRGASRSAVLREFAREALDADGARARERMRDLNRGSRRQSGDVVGDLHAGRHA